MKNSLLVFEQYWNLRYLTIRPFGKTIAKTGSSGIMKNSFKNLPLYDNKKTVNNFTNNFILT